MPDNPDRAAAKAQRFPKCLLSRIRRAAARTPASKYRLYRSSSARPSASMISYESPCASARARSARTGPSSQPPFSVLAAVQDLRRAGQSDQDEMRHGLRV